MITLLYIFMSLVHVKPHEMLSVLLYFLFMYFIFLERKRYEVMRQVFMLLTLLVSACGHAPFKGINFTSDQIFLGHDDEITKDLNSARGCEWIGSNGQLLVKDQESEDKLLSIHDFGLTTVHKDYSAIMELREYPNGQRNVGDLIYAKAQWKNVFLHEFGHALGLVHTESGIMRALYDDGVSYEDGISQILELLKETGNLPLCI